MGGDARFPQELAILGPGEQDVGGQYQSVEEEEGGERDIICLNIGDSFTVNSNES